MDKCPVCGGDFIVQCRCPLSHRQCAKGHQWHRCPVHDVIVVGPDDHKKPTNDCHCNDGEGK